MLGAMFDYVKQLYDQQLWSDLCQAGGMMLNMQTNVTSSMGGFSSPSSIGGSPNTSGQTDTTWLTSLQRLQICVMLGDAFLECKEHKRAESYFKEALQLKKHAVKAVKSKENVSDDEMSKATSEADLKYKLHRCYLAMQQPLQATKILESIPPKQQTPKSQMALGQLYQSFGSKRRAISCYREVLKACPMAVNAASMLMQLDVRLKEIQELTLDLTMSTEWYSMWLQAQSHFHSRDFGQAVVSLKQLEEKSLLKNDIGLLTTLAQAQYYQGETEYQAAMTTFYRIQKLEPSNLRGMDCLAAILCKEKKFKELETLAQRLMAISEDAPEPWIAMGYYCYLNRKGTRAVYFAHKACMINQQSVEALLLKGNILLDLKKHQDALSHFDEAMKFAPYRYEIHKGIVDCRLTQNRYREALGTAKTACEKLNGSPRVMTLLATVLMKDPFQTSQTKAKKVLQDILAKESSFLPAVYMLVEILEQEGDLSAAVGIIQKQISFQSTCKLHRMLADLLAKTNENEKAMEHYTLALNLDPKNAHAQEGLQKMEQRSDGSLEATYVLEMEDMNSEDGDLEESETEAVWSDGDLNPAAGNTTF